MNRPLSDLEARILGRLVERAWASKTKRWFVWGLAIGAVVGVVALILVQHFFRMNSVFVDCLRQGQWTGCPTP